MSEVFIDTNVIIRLLTGDDVEKQQRAKLLFERIERNELHVSAPLTVIADAVFVLSSPRLYNLPRSEIVALLMPLMSLPGFRIRNRRIALQALEIYLARNVDYSDAVILSCMRQAHSKTIYSFDEDFDHIQGITRQEP